MRKIIQLDQEKRKKDHLNYLIDIFQQTNLLSELKKITAKEYNLDNLNQKIALEFLHLNKKKDEIVYKINDENTKYFYLIKGSVTILIPKIKKIFINFFTFYHYLLKMEKLEENVLLLKNLQLNKYILPINNLKDFHNFTKIFLKQIFLTENLMEIFIEKNFELKDFENFFSGFNLKFNELSIDEEELKNLLILRQEFFSEKKKIEEDNLILKTQRKKIMKLSDASKIKENLWVEYLKEKFKVFDEEKILYEKNKRFLNDLDRTVFFSIITYEVFDYLNPGESFGFLNQYNIINTNNNSNNRSKENLYTIQCAEDCDFAFIENSSYENYIQEEKQRLLLKEALFINENFFLSSIKMKNFMKKIFSLF
jgi:hypothetical protein